MTVLPELERQLVRAADAGRPQHIRDSRRWVGLAVALAVVAAVGLVFATVGTRTPHVAKAPGSAARRPAGGSVRQNLMRPIHVPRLRPGEACPTSAGTRFTNRYLGGVALGRVPVRPDIGNRGYLRHGRIVLGTTDVTGWYAIKTIWFSPPSYDGPWLIRAVRLRGQGAIDLSDQPSPRPGPQGNRAGSRFSPTAVFVPAGPTLNTGAGYRTDPRTTWISAPGCYAWQVDGLNFSRLIVFEALAPRPLTR